LVLVELSSEFPEGSAGAVRTGLEKVIETPEWHEFTDKGGLKKAFLSGPDLRTWLETAEALHRDLIAKAGC
jgi:hypothetical protein